MSDVEYLNNYAIYNPCMGLNGSNSTLLDGMPEIPGITKVNYAVFRDLVTYEYGGEAIDAPGAAPCVDSIGAYYYLNSPAVMSALHIWSNLTDHWYMCNPNITYTPLPNASLWCYPLLLDAGVRMMFYSGDVDGSVPTVGTEKWIA